MHVIVETTLLCLIAYIVLVKRRRSSRDVVVLSETEVNEIIADWKPEPLGMSSSHLLFLFS